MVEGSGNIVFPGAKAYSNYDTRYGAKTFFTVDSTGIIISTNTNFADPTMLRKDKPTPNPEYKPLISQGREWAYCLVEQDSIHDLYPHVKIGKEIEKNGKLYHECYIWSNREVDQSDNDTQQPAAWLREENRTLRIDANERWTINLFSPDGVQIMTQNGLGAHDIPLNYLPSGIYIAILNSRNSLNSLKIMVP